MTASKTTLKKVGIIGGSGVYQLAQVKLLAEHDIKTPFGNPSARVKELEIEGHVVYMIPRHGENHQIAPSDINFRANIYALKMLGVNTVLSISAVGSLKEELSPTTFFLPDQFIDWTKGQRKRTFFDNGIVGHTSVANPVERALVEVIESIAKNEDIKIQKGGSYICIEGPQFSSKAESNIYRSFGASVIGMTNVPEAYLAKEAGMAYATIAMVTDYDCWKEEHCTLEEIMKVMSVNYKNAQKLLLKLVPALYKSNLSFETENKFSVVTKQECLSHEHHSILEVLFE